MTRKTPVPTMRATMAEEISCVAAKTTAVAMSGTAMLAAKILKRERYGTEATR